MSTTVQPRLLTLRETASELRCSERTVRRLIDRDGLPALRVGGSIRVDALELEAWLYEDPAVVGSPAFLSERDVPAVVPAVGTSARAGNQEAG